LFKRKTVTIATPSTSANLAPIFTGAQNTGAVKLAKIPKINKTQKNVKAKSSPIQANRIISSTDSEFACEFAGRDEGGKIENKMRFGSDTKGTIKFINFTFI
jgi:hypothetical protein